MLSRQTQAGEAVQWTGLGVQQISTFTQKPKMEVQTRNAESGDQCFTNQGTAHTSAQYTTFITFELIHRKSGGKASRVAVF